MARTLCGARKRIPREPQRRILVASLLIQNPTAAEHRGVTDDNFPAVDHEATAPLPKRRRTQRRWVAVAALDLPKEIMVWEIFIRLSAKDILRCRAVCRFWHDLTCASDFLQAHHQRQPTLPLVMLHRTISTDDGLPFHERCRPVLDLGLDNYEVFQLLASCDGLLLLHFSDGRYSICNPVTLKCAPLSCLSAAGHIRIVTLYRHRLSGEYRVLYWKEAAYYILMVRRGRSAPRCIGIPSNTPGTENSIRTWHGMTPTNYSGPPVVFRNCLHWSVPNNARIVVFDTLLESFRFMRRPAGVTTFATRLCDMEGSVGFSCLDYKETAAKIWVLEDYEREVWSIKYHVNLPRETFSYLQDKRHLVLSQKGDVLVYSCFTGYMFHCDNTGKLLEEFKCEPWSLSAIGHCFKESLVKQDISLRRGCVRKLRFFQRI